MCWNALLIVAVVEGGKAVRMQAHEMRVFYLLLSVFDRSVFFMELLVHRQDREVDSITVRYSLLRCQLHYWLIQQNVSE